MGKQGLRNSPEHLPERFASLLSLRTETKQQLLQACYQNVQGTLANL
jgi:TatD DNase family protein